MVNTKISLIIFFAAKKGEALYSQQKQDQELTVAHHELLIAKFRLKLKKVGKTTRPFRYDLNQIPYDYIVEVRNRFKGLGLIDCQKNYGCRFMIFNMRQRSRPSPTKRNAKKAKWLSDKALQIAVKRSKRQRRKGKLYPFECRVPKK